MAGLEALAKGALGWKYFVGAFLRYWWPQMQWSGNYEDLPADTILNMEHKHMTPEAYNANDPNFNTQPDATRWTG